MNNNYVFGKWSLDWMRLAVIFSHIVLLLPSTKRIGLATILNIGDKLATTFKYYIRTLMAKFIHNFAIMHGSQLVTVSALWSTACPTNSWCQHDNSLFSFVTIPNLVAITSWDIPGGFRQTTKSI